MTLPEITEPILLCDDAGNLNRAAVGWSRAPLHTSNLTGRGRAKRWEYWAVQAPTHVLAVTVSDLDYATLCAVFVLEPDGTQTNVAKLAPLKRLDLPDTCGGGPVHVDVRGLRIDLVPGGDHVRLLVNSDDVIAEVQISRPAGHESLGVVVPWSDTRFQYTVKENTLPARGRVVVGGRVHAFGDGSWATLDHGRGKWPHRVTWNWGSGSGIVDDTLVGVQVGGKWTDGTGSTENALCLDGRLHYVEEELAWHYDRGNWLADWHIRTPGSDRVSLHFTPEHLREDRINLGVVANDTHQVFGTWRGSMRTSDGMPVRVDGIRGWVEEVVNRW